MSNTILTPTAVTRKALQILHQKLTFIGSINRQYDDSFAKQGAKIGDSLKIRLPNQYTVTTGAALSLQDTTESSVTLQVATQKHVGMHFTSAELTLSMDDFSERIIEPAMAALAADVEADALGTMRKTIYQQANNTSAAITMANVLGGRRKLNDSLAPMGNRHALLSSNDAAEIVNAYKGLFQDDGQLGKQYREGSMGRHAGFDFAETSHLSTQDRGSGVVNTYDVAAYTFANGQATLDVDVGTGTLVVGDIFTIDGVYSVHPETKVSTGVLQQFVLLTAETSGTNTWSISPAMYTSGPLQNINAAPAENATITIVGTASTPYGQSLVYHRDAFTFATADLVMPKGVDWGAREVYDGISLRIVRDYDINNDRLPCRVDILYGYKTLRPQLACRLANLAG